MGKLEERLRTSAKRTSVVAVRGERATTRSDHVAGEEPMEIRAGGAGQEPVPVAVTMRTPGNDFELAAGFLFTEGLIAPRDIVKVSYCDALDVTQEFNVVTVRLNKPFDSHGLERNFYAASSCGICGKASLDHVALQCPAIPPGLQVGRSLITELPHKLREGQKTFTRTGGLHAAGFFDATGGPGGLREDVGRHNALDKLIGKALLAGDFNCTEQILMVSGRAGFEIVQKAAMARVPVVCAVSAPSSLAVDAAERLGVTLVGFLRGDDFNIYAHPERIDTSF
ncbi:MAG: formate dehydrogenase accessory sulfurtransferase FdhD [Actinomycetota bacterium]|nr:formate dehydrogenase accessory sulfurtransferase FdhD [Actinomycetota bacterium]